MKKRVNLSIEEKIYDAFQKHCQERGMKASAKVELFMKKELGIK